MGLRRKPQPGEPWTGPVCYIETDHYAVKVVDGVEAGPDRSLRVKPTPEGGWEIAHPNDASHFHLHHKQHVDVEVIA